ncbi:AmmeMemoRadiSam system protein B [Candidatus Woesearchaeota archaeon]|nr:AmmeMemoRadiSam system protein B [Candidatus Woesearchaeota archaeon]
MTTRRAVVAGTFYESDFHMLEQQLVSCFRHKKGPGELPVKRGEKQIKAVVAPHAAYHYSGACAAWSFQQVAEAKFADCYVMLGPNHSGMGKSGISLSNWETPLGVVRVDKELGGELAKKSELVVDESAHSREHSLEVQLPFLQFVSKDRLKDLKVLPISIKDDINLHRLALDIKDVLVDYDKRVVFIVSSDFTHYGATYGYLPFSSDIPQRLYDLDMGAIKHLLKLDAMRFMDYVNETGATICGVLPLILLVKLLSKTEGKLLQYYTSADIMGDFRNAVGYASLVFD